MAAMYSARAIMREKIAVVKEHAGCKLEAIRRSNLRDGQPQDGGKTPCLSALYKRMMGICKQKWCVGDVCDQVLQLLLCGVGASWYLSTDECCKCNVIQ